MLTNVSVQLESKADLVPRLVHGKTVVLLAYFNKMRLDLP